MFHSLRYRWRPRNDDLHEDSGQGYLASVSDLMIGVIFMFMVVMMIFALRVRVVAEQADKVNEAQGKCQLLPEVTGQAADLAKCVLALIGKINVQGSEIAGQKNTIEAQGKQVAAQARDIAANAQQIGSLTATNNALQDKYDRIAHGIAQQQEYRASFLRTVQRKLENVGVKVQIDEAAGILHLGAAVNFATGRADLEPDSEAYQHVEAVAMVLMGELPCYTWDQATCAKRTEVNAGVIDAMLVEGHTDRQEVRPGGRFADNYALSTARAWTVYNQIKATQAGMATLHNKCGQLVMSLSGYGPDRPIEKDKEDSLINRRIDIRFLVSPPALPDQEDSGCQGTAR